MMQNSRRVWMAALIVTAMAGITVALVGSTRAGNELANEPILAFSTVRGSVPNVEINDNRSAGSPWVIGDGDGVLRVHGDVDILIRGLVLAPSVANGGGTNPVHSFRAIVSC